MDLLLFMEGMRKQFYFKKEPLYAKKEIFAVLEKKHQTTNKLVSISLFKSIYVRLKKYIPKTPKTSDLKLNFMPDPDTKTCLDCGTKFTGRIDKKFCSDQCRVSFNNRLNSSENNYVRNVSNILRKNRRILTELNTTGKTRINSARLKEKGFDFQYFTNLYKTREGTIYYYCYEQGYLPIENDNYLLVVKHDFNK